MKVSIIDRQRAGRVDGKRLGEFVQLVMGHVRPVPPATDWHGVSVILTGDALIRRVNRDFLGHDEPTDVISFTYPALPGPDSGPTGEVFVNVQQALRLGARYGGAARELALYAAHGCDHLGGAEDATPGGRRRMRNRECRWLRSPDGRRLTRHLVDDASAARPGTRKR